MKPACAASLARAQAHLNLSFVCAAASFAEVMRLGTKIRRPPCSSPPLAVTIVGRCAVVMVARWTGCRRGKFLSRCSEHRGLRYRRRQRCEQLSLSGYCQVRDRFLYCGHLKHAAQGNALGCARRFQTCTFRPPSPAGYRNSGDDSHVRDKSFCGGQLIGFCCL